MSINDADIEADEEFLVNLSALGSTNELVLDSNTTSIFITDNDGKPLS